MASRRTRIKGIANIPQRRKNVTTTSEEATTENDDLTTGHNEEELIKTKQKTDSEIKEREIEISPKEMKDPLTSIVSKHVLENNTQNLTSEETGISNNCNENSDVPTTDPSPVRGVETDQTLLRTEDSSQKTKTVTAMPQENNGSKPFLKRRTFIKPIISASVINRKSKAIVEKEPILPPSLNNSKETVESDIVAETLQQDLKQKEGSNVGQEFTLDEVNLTSQNNKSDTDIASDKSVRKIVPQVNNAPNSDTEYPPPPPSPSKINRSRIKAIPRLGYRKTSFSASESEDESKRIYNRNRNDSVCSTASGVPESIADCMSPQRPRDLGNMLQKKCNRTEQSRKLAEARREFQRRFGTNKPDRQSLTMMDLIFYNPTSNPMVNEEKSQNEEILNSEQDLLEPETTDKPDDPPERAEENGKSDEENEIPAPQIKIGPSGEIILDEKSLVIENKEVKRQREELQKTKIVDGNFETGYGIYKRQKRSKDWSHTETLRFYKALNTIGTDFSLMCELFPRRTRRELKLKFKKEERINRGLIDRAVMQPCNFDYAILKHEVDMEEKELAEVQRQKEEELRLKRERLEKRQTKKRKAPEKPAEPVENSQESCTSPRASPDQPRPSKTRRVCKPRQKKFNIESLLEDSDADVSDIATQSESEGEDACAEEVVLKPTRSGRIPKVTKKFDVSEPNGCTEKTKPTAAGGDDIEPGSIMVMTEQGQNGEPVYKIYMVTPDKDAVPLQLNSEVVSKAVELKKGVRAQNILTISTSVIKSETVIEGDRGAGSLENNVTIPADENITTLRSNEKQGLNAALSAFTP